MLGRTGDSVYRLDADAYWVNDLIIGGVFPLATSALTLGVMFVILMRLDLTHRAAVADGRAVPVLVPPLLLADDDPSGRAGEGAGSPR